jgi:DNA-directed RNA polymerase subunit RPC12/RpoP
MKLYRCERCLREKYADEFKGKKTQNICKECFSEIIKIGKYLKK